MSSSERWLASAVLVVFGLLAGAPPHAAEMAASPAERLQRYLDGLTSFQAEFHQVSSGIGASGPQQAAGRLYLQKPGRFRWDYRQPNAQQIVSDGTNLWLYDEDLAQVTVKPVDGSLSTTPALLLAGKAGLADSFQVSDGGEAGGLSWVRLDPKRNDTDFTEFRLGFAGGELKAMELKDKLQQSTRIEFSGVQRNPRLSTSLFHFTPPAGVDVIGKPRP